VRICLGDLFFRSERIDAFSSGTGAQLHFDEMKGFVFIGWGTNRWELKIPREFALSETGRIFTKAIRNSVPDLHREDDMYDRLFGKPFHYTFGNGYNDIDSLLDTYDSVKQDVPINRG